jgi:hypothetical protein
MAGKRWTPRWCYHEGKPGLAARLIPYCTLDGGPANKVHPPAEGEILMLVQEHDNLVSAIEGEVGRQKKLADGAQEEAAQTIDDCTRGKYITRALAFEDSIRRLQALVEGEWQ